jgi:hypothetical protein
MSKQEEASPQDSQHPTNDRSEDHLTTKTKGLAELALLYIGIPGVTLYPLGLLALLVQLLRDPHFPFYDPVTVWTAISVIPHTVVIGTGISLVYVSLVAALAGLEVYYLTLLLLHLWQKHKNPSSGSETSSTRRERRRVLRWSLLLLPLLPLALSAGLGDLNFDRPGDIFVFVGFIVFSCGGGALAGYIRDRRYPRGPTVGLLLAISGLCLLPCASLRGAILPYPR